MSAPQWLRSFNLDQPPFSKELGDDEAEEDVFIVRLDEGLSPRWGRLGGGAVDNRLARLRLLDKADGLPSLLAAGTFFDTFALETWNSCPPATPTVSPPQRLHLSAVHSARRPRVPTT